jgi:hypothetical protein
MRKDPDLIVRRFCEPHVFDRHADTNDQGIAQSKLHPAM